MGAGDAGDRLGNATITEQLLAGGLVAMAGAAELVRVEHLSDVVERCAEEHGVTVERERGLGCSDGVGELARNVVHEDQVHKQAGRSVEVSE